MKIALLLLLLMSPSCATVDCSVYKTTDARRCRCIRENGDHVRAQRCSAVATKAFREKARKRCFQRCFSNCEKCNDL